jgi:hypothetical protein
MMIIIDKWQSRRPYLLTNENKWAFRKQTVALPIAVTAVGSIFFLGVADAFARCGGDGSAGNSTALDASSCGRTASMASAWPDTPDPSRARAVDAHLACRGSVMELSCCRLASRWWPQARDRRSKAGTAAEEKRPG